MSDGIVRICLHQGTHGYLCNKPYGHANSHGWSDYSWENNEPVLRDEEPTETLFRVWHIPQIPMQPFYVNCKTTEEAVKIQDVLAYYDLFQFEHSIKPDYSNASGVEEFYNGEWAEVDDEALEIWRD